MEERDFFLEGYSDAKGGITYIRRPSWFTYENWTSYKDGVEAAEKQGYGI